MKKRIILMIGLLLMLTGLSSCRGAVNAANDAQASELLNANYENALPVEVQLAVGTLALDNTENAIDAQTAAELLPLWKALRSFSESDSVAAEEIRAVYKQIQETMTPEQVQAIAAFQLTREDMTQLAEKMGLNFGGGAGRFGELTPEMQATIQAARETGEFPQGGFPRGGPGAGGFPGGPGGGGFQGGELNLAQQATAQARRASSAGRNPGVPSAVLDAVIEYLEGVMQ